MTQRHFAISAALGAALLLSACATISDAPAGPLKVGSGYDLDLGREWSDISQTMIGRTKNVRLLSIDGPLLDRLYVTDGLAPGDFLIKPVVKERPTPTVRKDMTASERMEFVTDSVAALDYQRVQAVKPRPGKLGSADAIRLDLTAQTKEGLEMAGTAVVATMGGKLYVILYIAPAEHYYKANLDEVEHIIGSARLGG